jgi:acetoin utilization protein AcuB
MRLFEVMTQKVETVAPATPAADAWELMHRRRIRHLVVTRGGDILGVVSDRDLGGRAGARVRQGKNVAELMTPHAVTMGLEDTVRRAANLMRGRSIGCVPIAAGKRLVGIVTTSDLLTLLGRGVERPAQSVRRGLSYRAPHRKRHRTAGAW